MYSSRIPSIPVAAQVSFPGLEVTDPHLPIDSQVFLWLPKWVPPASSYQVSYSCPGIPIDLQVFLGLPRWGPQPPSYQAFLIPKCSYDVFGVDAGILRCVCVCVCVCVLWVRLLSQIAFSIFCVRYVSASRCS